MVDRHATLALGKNLRSHISDTIYAELFDLDVHKDKQLQIQWESILAGTVRGRDSFQYSHGLSAACQLCGYPKEDQEHLFHKCSKNEPARVRHKEAINNIPNSSCYTAEELKAACNTTAFRCCGIIAESAKLLKEAD